MAVYVLYFYLSVKALISTKVTPVHNNFRNSDNQKKEVPIVCDLTIAQMTSINIMTYIARQCNCLNFCLPLFMASLTFVSLVLRSGLKVQQLLDNF